MLKDVVDLNIGNLDQKRSSGKKLFFDIGYFITAQFETEKDWRR